MKRRALLLIATVILSSCDSGSGVTRNDLATAAPRDCSGATVAGDFYQPPTVLPAGQPGDLLRCQPLSTPLSGLARATLVMYLSTDVNGEPMAVTGVVFEPMAEWSGIGPRPLVGYTDGTYGQGDQCALSRLLAEGVHYAPPLDAMLAYESLFIGDLLREGIAVAVTDYHQFGTPGDHTYLNRTEAAHSNIDMVRAARRLPGGAIPTQGPLAFAGYSQGGHAAASTAERLPIYAPELVVAGIYAGAAPSDLAELMEFNDGGAFMGVVGYYLNGLAAAYPQLEAPIDAALNAAGKQLREETAQQCIPETAVRYGFQQSQSFTLEGGRLADLLRSEALSAWVVQDGLGGRMPTAPVLLAIGASDDIVPVAGVRRLRANWCALGATLEYYELPGPALPISTSLSHIAFAPQLYSSKAKSWLLARLRGEPVQSNCP